MASFTDAISQFNPYVQQLPVDAMVQVGKYKQDKYDQGVQKIQTYVDNIAGMDVIKPEHKQYLQSKLNELGSKLKTVAAGDFSDSQLVNSVGGMATQIIKDPTVQNAVYSTQRVRKEQQAAEDARKAGKSSPNNDAYFNDQLNSWLTDKNINSQFNGRYIEYHDVDKKLRDLGETIKKTAQEYGVENPYIRDNAGQTLYYHTDKSGKQVASTDPSSGQPKYDMAMLSVKVKGTPAEQLLNNFMDSLDSKDEQQLRIDAWAHYRGANMDTFKQDIVNNYKQKKKFLDDELTNIAVQLENPKLSSVEKTKLQARLTDIGNDRKSGSLEAQMADDIKQLESNDIDNFKYKLYTQKYLGNLARDMANKSYIQEYKSNPYAQMDMERKKLQFQYFQENNQMSRFNASENRLWTEFRQRQKEWDFKNKGSEFKVTPGGIPTGETGPTIKTLESDVSSTADDFNKLGMQYADILFPKGKYPDMSGEDKLKAMGKLAQQYRENPTMDLTSNQRKYLEKYRQYENDLTGNLNLLNATKDHVLAVEKAEAEKQLAGKGLDLGTVSFSGGELNDFRNKANTFVKTIAPTGPGAGAYTSVDAKGILDYFKGYQGGKYLPLATAYIKNSSKATVLNSDERKIVNALDKVGNAAGDIFKATSQAEQDFISKFSPKYALQRAPLNMENTMDKQGLDALLATKQAQYGQAGALDTDALKDYNPETINGWMTGKESKGVKFVLEKKRAGGAQVVVYGPDGTSKQVVPMTDGELATFFPQAAQRSPLDDVKNKILTSPGHTTNAANVPDGNPAAAVNAYYSGYQIPGLEKSKYAPVTRVDIQGDPNNTGSADTDGYDVILYVQDPQTKTWKSGTINKGGYATEGGVINILAQLSPTAVEQAIKNFK